MTISTITPFTGTVPNRTQSQSAFNTNVAAFLTWLDGLGDELVISIPQMNTDIAQANTDATTASAASATATAAANATAYSGSATYNYPDTVIGSDGHAYRCIDTGVSGDNPVGSETGDWQQISVDPADYKSAIEGRKNLLIDPQIIIRSDNDLGVAPGTYGPDVWFCPNNETYAVTVSTVGDYTKLTFSNNLSSIAQFYGFRSFASGGTPQIGGVKEDDYLTVSAEMYPGETMKVYAGYGTAVGSNITTTLLGTLSDSVKSFTFQADFNSSVSTFLVIQLANVNALDNPRFKNLKVNSGQVATPFEEPNVYEERRKAQWLYTRSYNYDVPNGAVTDVGAVDCLNYSAGATTVLSALPCKVQQMRTTPTVTIYSSGTGTAGEVRDVGGATDLTVASIVGLGDTGFSRINLTDSLSSLGAARFHYVMDARP